MSIDVEKDTNGNQADVIGDQDTITSGDAVVWTFEVVNDGEVDLANVVVTDTVVIDNGTVPDPLGVVCDWANSSDAATPARNLSVGETVTCTSSSTAVAGQYKNVVDVVGTPVDDAETADPDDPERLTPPGGDPLPDVVDEDPSHYIGVDPVFDLSLIKTLAGGQSAAPLSTDTSLAFEISVVNQGEAPANNIVVTEHVPAGMVIDHAATDAANAGNANWKNNLDDTFTIGSLLGGDTESFTVVLVPAGGGDLSAWAGSAIVNGAEISADDGDDVDSTPGDGDSDPLIDGPNSHNDLNYDPDDDGDVNEVTPGDEDDHDREQVLVQPAPEAIYDLSLIKELSDAQSVSPASTESSVRFEITVINQGEIAAAAVVVEDYVPAGMEIDHTATDIANGGSIQNNYDDTFTIASLPVGASVSFEVVVVPVGGGDLSPWAGTQIVNGAEIVGDDGDDVDSTPDPSDTDETINHNDPGYDPDDDGDVNEVTPGDEDDHDRESVTVQTPDPGVYDLTLIKALATGQSAAPAASDTQVAFTVTVKNQGSVDANGVDVADYVPANMVIDQAATNAANAANTNVVNNGDDTFTVGSIASGQAVSWTIVVKPISGDLSQFVGLSIVNGAEIIGDDGDDIDSSPDGTDDDPLINHNDVDYDPDNDGDLNETTAGDEDDHDREQVTPVAPEEFSIASFVWHDEDDDGIQDASEPAMAGAVVSLVVDNGSGVFVPAVTISGGNVAAQTVGADGLFFFGELPAGDYRVRVTVPTGWEAGSVQNSQNNSNVASDSNIASGSAASGYESATFTLSSGDEPAETGNYRGDNADDDNEANGNMTVDFGFKQTVTTTTTTTPSRPSAVFNPAPYRAPNIVNPPQVTVQATPRALAFTGNTTTPWLATAAALFIAGGATIITARREQETDNTTV